MSGVIRPPLGPFPALIGPACCLCMPLDSAVALVIYHGPTASFSRVRTPARAWFFF